MARRSGRLSAGSNMTSAHKRAGSSTIVADSTKSKRAKANATPTKSEYFDQSDVQTDASDLDEESVSPDDEASEFGEDDKASESSNVSDEVETDASESESKTRKSSKTGPRKNAELWRPGVKTGLGHGTQVIIKKIKARPAGDIPYSDDTIHANTMLFLSDLKVNNDRQWLKMHDAEFRQAEKDFYSFLEGLTEKLTEIDDTIPELPVKDIVSVCIEKMLYGIFTRTRIQIFRIYRDVRFSKDPTPYKVSRPAFTACSAPLQL
nr:hypothetical protein CFP56_53365 [Quercus suber]